jgi:hypothetical protein
VESKAILKFIRISPTKARRVVPLIKGKKAGDAMIHLGFLPHSGGRIIAKVLKSAMANAEQKKVADPESKCACGPGTDHEENEAACHGQGRCYQKKNKSHNCDLGRIDREV